MNKIIHFLFFTFLGLIASGQTADFSYQSSDGLFCSPSSINFTQTSTGNPVGFVWDFGNGSIVNSSNASTYYSSPGTYNVQLIVIYKNNTITVNKSIIINPGISVAIGLDRNYICTPGAINFTASGSASITNYEWDFGDGQPILNTTVANIAHTFTNFKSFPINLKATNGNGCVARTATTIYVKAPEITGTISPTSGCVPINASFNSNVNVPVGGSVTQYSWDFGDGNSIVNTSNSISHVYSNAGEYAPTLQITTNEGCTNNFSFTPIGYGTPPYNTIGYSLDSVICGSGIAELVVNATNANRFLWTFGDNETASVVDTFITHRYATLGVKTITATPSYNGCNGTPVSFQVKVEGVIASYDFSNTCADRKTYSFTNTTQGNQSLITWDFGDGSAIVHTANAVHTFPLNGSFVTRLTVIDSITGCIDSYDQTIYTANPVLQNPDTSICRKTNTTFTLLNNYNSPGASYFWQVAGEKRGPYPDTTITVSANFFGNFYDYVEINLGPESCPDTVWLNHYLEVKGPDLNFSSPVSICLKDQYQPINSSKPYLPGDSVLTWLWDFGVDSTRDSTYQPRPYIYKNASSYNVKLTARDVNGCIDSLIKPVVVNSLPILFVIPKLDTLCAGGQTTLIAFHRDPIGWTPAASLSCANCDTVVARPMISTEYVATATNSFGCKVNDTSMVRVFSPFTTMITGGVPICQNDSLQLMVTPAGKMIQWAPAVGLTSYNQYNPVAFPGQTTTYTATLKDSVGCFTSTADFEVKVKSLPVVKAGPDQVIPYYSNFTISPQYSKNVTKYV
ncbi:MAG: PKD domain-containing protein, partial [Ginsengibacter sp.]